jgi:hypothetical protein
MAKNVKRKLLDARGIISNTKMKKAGSNKFSNYDYFTPDQVDKLVFDACNQTGLLTVFNFLRKEDGYEGTLTVYDVDSDSEIVFTMATDVPEIKATNITQKIGGSTTYTERYLKMTAFGIMDNSLDFDSQKPATQSVPEKKKMTKAKYETYTKGVASQEFITEDNRTKTKAIFNGFSTEGKSGEYVGKLIKLLDSKPTEKPKK